jgi:hypothetical protein
MADRSVDELREEALRMHRLLAEGRALHIQYAEAAHAYALAVAEQRRNGDAAPSGIPEQ